jgi:hypothetical protein
MPNFIPIRQYNSNQIILTSDRLIFNSKADNIILSSNNDVSINMNGAMHINIGPSGNQTPAKNFFVINAAKIQMGTGNVEPLPKGDTLGNLLTSLMNALNDLATSLSTATGIGVGTVGEPTVNAAGVKLQGAIANIQDQIVNIKSKVSFTA